VLQPYLRSSHEIESYELVLGLATGIQIPHDDVKHLSRDPGVALGHGHVGPELAFGIGEIAIRPRHRRQARSRRE